MKKSVLFVCAGNTCRSPMAEFILKRKCPELKVSSAGVYAIDGQPMSEQAKVVLKAENYPEEEIARFESKKITGQDLKEDNTIFVMNAFLKNILENLGRRENVYLLARDDIPDPFGQSVEDYQIVKNMIEQAIENQLKK